MNYRSMIDIIRGRAQLQPRRRAYVFLDDGEKETATLNYEELDSRARGVAALLQQYEAACERVLLLYPPGLDYIVSFLGCLYAGAVAVPAYPPRPNRPSLRIQGIVKDCTPKIVLAPATTLARIKECFADAPHLADLHWLGMEDLSAELACGWREAHIRPDSLAFLQYTSGSTSTPKGVMVSHANLLSNEEGIKQACGHTEDSTFVGWLPLYHDMGLIGTSYSLSILAHPQF